MRTILYLHDLHHSSDEAVAFLKGRFPSDRILHPEIPLSPKEAVKYLHNVYDKAYIDLIIGDSLGAFYAMTFSRCKKVLIHPSIMNREDIDLCYKNQTPVFPFNRRDGVKSFEINESFRDELNDIYTKIFDFKEKGNDDQYGFNPYNTYFAVDRQTFQSERFNSLDPYIMDDHIGVFGGECHSDCPVFYRGLFPFITEISSANSKGIILPMYQKDESYYKFRCPVCRQKTLLDENDFCENCNWNEEFDGNSYLCYQDNRLDEETYEKMNRDITYFGRIFNARKAYQKYGSIR